MTGRVAQVDLRLTAAAFAMYEPLSCIVSTLAEDRYGWNGINRFVTRRLYGQSLTRRWRKAALLFLLLKRKANVIDALFVF